MSPREGVAVSRRVRSARLRRRPRAAAPPSRNGPPAVPAVCSVEEAVRVLKAGEMLVVVDDADRENEGGLLLAAEQATPAAVNFIARESRGSPRAPMGWH